MWAGRQRTFQGSGAPGAWVRLHRPGGNKYPSPEHLVSLRLELRAASELRVEGRASPAWHPSVSRRTAQLLTTLAQCWLAAGLLKTQFWSTRRSSRNPSLFQVLTPALVSSSSALSPQFRLHSWPGLRGQTSWRGGPWGEPGALVTPGTGLKTKVT